MNALNWHSDYLIVQTFQDSDFKVSQSLQRIDGQFQLNVDVVVHFHDFNKFQPICNLLVEKLDEHVRLSGPNFDHTPSKLEAARHVSRCYIIFCILRTQKHCTCSYLSNVNWSKLMQLWEGYNLKHHT